ncbi:MAG: DUF6807 domain-containing protein [Planctomycetota bacterium]|jgi:hypothetical protein
MALSSDRRSFIKQAAAVVGSSVLMSGGSSTGQSSGGAGKKVSAGEKFSCYRFGSCIWVRIDKRVFTCYRTESTQKYPYFYPVVGPVTGLPMTAETELPWPHHRSLFLGCDRVNGGNYWQAGVDTGQIISRGAKVDLCDGLKAVIVDHCDWKQPDKPAVIDDQRLFTISAPSPGQRIIDADITLKAKVDIHISKTNHSLFAIRVDRGLAPDGGGVLINSEGLKGEKATFGQVARWVGFYGTRLGKAESIVLMDHTGNPWSPCKWFTRDYGNTSPTIFQWLGKEGWRLAEGESIGLRYRVLVSGGAIDVGRMNGLYEQFAKS